jgi:hypothetical protein
VGVVAQLLALTELAQRQVQDLAIMEPFLTLELLLEQVLARWVAAV